MNYGCINGIFCPHVEHERWMLTNVPASTDRKPSLLFTFMLNPSNYHKKHLTVTRAWSIDKPIRV